MKKKKNIFVPIATKFLKKYFKINKPFYKSSVNFEMHPYPKSQLLLQLLY